MKHAHNIQKQLKLVDPPPEEGYTADVPNDPQAALIAWQEVQFVKLDELRAQVKAERERLDTVRREAEARREAQHKELEYIYERAIEDTINAFDAGVAASNQQYDASVSTAKVPVDALEGELEAAWGRFCGEAKEKFGVDYRKLSGMGQNEGDSRE